MKKIAVLLIFVFCFGVISPAFADSRIIHINDRHHHHHHYHRHESDNTGAIVAAGVLGLLVGAAIADSSKSEPAKPAPAETPKPDYQQKAKDILDTELKFLVETIERKGEGRALEYIDDYWHNKSVPTLYKFGDTVSSLQVADVHNGFSVLYLVDVGRAEATVRVEQPDNDIKEERTRGYIRTAESIVDLQKKIGFTLSDGSRDEHRYMKALSVVQGTAAWYLGIRTGTVIYSIDRIDTSQTDYRHIAQYIAESSEAHATIEITIMQNGAKKNCLIKL